MTSDSLKPTVYHFIPGDGPNALIQSIALSSEIEVKVLTLYNTDMTVPDYCKKNNISVETLGFSNKSTFKQFISFIRFLHKQKPQLLFAHSFYPSAMIALGSLFYRKGRFVSVRHHNKVHIISKNHKGIVADKFISRETFHTVCVSEAVKETMIYQGCDENKLTVIYNGLLDPGIKHQAQVSRQTNSNYQLIALGRIDWQKNYEGMLRVMGALKLEGFSFHLRILGAGNDDYLTSLKSIQLDLGLADCVEWCGRKSDIYEYLDQADLFVHTAKDEACPLVLLETMMFGIPIASSNLGGCKDLLSGFYEGCDPEDIVRFAKMIGETLGNLEAARLHASEISSVVIDRFGAMKMQEAYTSLSLNLLSKIKVA